jgi:5-methylcytosine-specific restriction endonuclease McrA
MSNDLLDKPIVLKLNRLWQRIGWCTPRQALVAMCGGMDGGSPPMLGMSVSEENGQLTESTPTKWEDWIKLPVREGDLILTTSRGPIRCPTILIAPTYDKVPHKTPKLTNQSIHERDGFIDQYTGEKLSRSEASVDHVVPKSRGGKNAWNNMVTCKKDRNHKKSNRFNHEVGLKLIRKPYEPKSLPISETIKEARHKSHEHFIR